MSTWTPVLNLIGATGATGATGAQSTVPGPTGSTGPTGAQSTVPGPTGGTGTLIYGDNGMPASFAPATARPGDFYINFDDGYLYRLA